MYMYVHVHYLKVQCMYYTKKLCKIIYMYVHVGTVCIH